MRALGTRFAVRQEDARTHVAVLEGGVEIQPQAADGSAVQVLHAGRQASFTAVGIGGSSPVDDAAVAWTQGMLFADKMRLGDLAEALARYRRGVLRCDPLIAGLRVSGSFPIRDTDRALAMLESTYPLRAVHGTRYWVVLVPR